VGSDYSATAEWYDYLYANKDYQGECEILLDTLRERKAGFDSILDVACGTGRHIEHLKAHFGESAGLDICASLLEQARQRNPELCFHLADMTDFALSRSFDVITCLFSAIGHLTTPQLYKQALRCFHRHLTDCGFLVVEPWLEPARWRANTCHMQTVDLPKLKISRQSTSFPPEERDGVSISAFGLHHLVSTPQNTRYTVDHFEMALYTREEHLDMFRSEGFEAEWLEPGLTGRGLIVARKV